MFFFQGTSHFKVVDKNYLEQCHYLAKNDLQRELERKSLSPKKGKNSKVDRNRRVCSFINIQ